jgi:ribulose-5-phosphate 4-epimerase/fuculose-1-phosphate aldolase
MGNVRDSVSEEEWAVREDLAACYRLVARQGWDDLVFTHISARVPGPEHHFLINPFGLLFDEITASSLVKIDLDGNVVLDTGYPVNAAGFTIHSAIHQTSEEHQCVLHLHTLDGTAVASNQAGLLPLNQTGLLVLGDLAYHDYEGVALDLDERERLVRDLGDKHLMLLRNHGTLTVGSTVAEAFTRMYFLERACSMQVRTLSLPGAVVPVSAEVIEKTAGQGETLGKAADALVWPALRRKLDREDPSYRD